VEGMRTMRNIGLAAVVAGSLAATGCATYPNQYGYDPYYNNGYYPNGYYGNGYANPQAGRVVGGAAIGAATGAVAGAVIPGVSVGQGAIAGAILGGVLGATVNGRQYYRDTRGYCYYVDQYGQPHYSYDIRC
jgi:hypothetical protein